MRGNGDVTLTERLLAAQRPRPWATLSSIERSAQMDAVLAQLRDVTAQHNALARLVVELQASRDAHAALLSAAMSRQDTAERLVLAFTGMPFLARLRWLVTGR